MLFSPQTSDATAQEVHREAEEDEWHLRLQLSHGSGSHEYRGKRDSKNDTRDQGLGLHWMATRAWHGKPCRQ